MWSSYYCLYCEIKSGINTTIERQRLYQHSAWNTVFFVLELSMQ